MKKKNYLISSFIIITVFFAVLFFAHSTPKTEAEIQSQSSSNATSGVAIFQNLKDEGYTTNGYTLYFDGNVGGVTDTGASANMPVTVTYDPSAKTFSGFAWSPTYGWVQFNSNGTARALTLVGLNDTETPTDWAKGLIKLNGNDGGSTDPIGIPPGISSNISYGVTCSMTSGACSGYAWGGNEIGWIDFSGVKITPTPTPPSCTLTLAEGGTQDTRVLKWSGTNLAVGSDTCIATGNGDGTWGGTQPYPMSPTDGMDTGILTEGVTYNFYLSCKGTDGTYSPKCSATYTSPTIPLPTCTITPAVSTINSGGSVILHLGGHNLTTLGCVMTGGSGLWSSLSDTFPSGVLGSIPTFNTGALTSSPPDYKMECLGLGTYANCSAKVKVCVSPLVYDSVSDSCITPPVGFNCDNCDLAVVGGTHTSSLACTSDPACIHGVSCGYASTSVSGVFYTSEPTTGFCSDGSSPINFEGTGIGGSGPWTWTCGSNSYQCSALTLTAKCPPPDTTVCYSSQNICQKVNQGFRTCNSFSGTFNNDCNAITPDNSECKTNCTPGKQDTCIKDNCHLGIQTCNLDGNGWSDCIVPSDSDSLPCITVPKKPVIIEN